MIMKRQFILRWVRVTALFFVIPLLIHMHISLLAAVDLSNNNRNDNGDEDISEEIFKEFEVKATIIEKIVPFIEWPKNTNIDDTSKPFVIGVFGRTPFKKILEETYARKRVLEKKVEVRSISDLEEIPGCHLLFISYAAKPSLPKIIRFVKDKAILTMSDTRGFSSRGVHITLFIRHEQIMFNINKKAIDTSGLLARWHILKHAAEVY